MRLTKHVFSRLNLDDELIDVANTEFVDARNIIPSRDGNAKRIEKAPGTTNISLTLPIGTNTCVGKVNDNDNNVAFLLIHNSNGNHTIAKVTAAKVASVVLTWSGLGFTGAKIPHIAINDGILFWAEDGGTGRTLNLTRVQAGELTSANLTEQGTLLLKSNPILKLDLSALNTSSVVNNEQLYGNKYKFAYRYVFIDNETSALSANNFISQHYSYDEYSTPPTFNINTIRVVLSYESGDEVYIDGVAQFIKRIEFFVKKNNEPYKKIRSVLKSELNLSLENQYLTIGGTTGDITAGQTITGTTSGATGEIISYNSPNMTVALTDPNVRLQVESFTTATGGGDISSVSERIYTFDFHGESTGQVLASSEEARGNDDVFDEITGLEVVDSRLMLSGRSKGFEFSRGDVGIEHNPDFVNNHNQPGRAKEGEEYEIGLVFYDKYGVKAGAISYEDWVKSIPRAYPNHPSVQNGTIAYTRNNFIYRDQLLDPTAEYQLSVRATGTPPEWAHKYQFAVRARKIQNSCMAACKVRFLACEEHETSEFQKKYPFQEYDATIAETGILNPNKLEIDASGAIYLLKEWAVINDYEHTEGGNTITAPSRWNGMIDIELPNQFPFTPDTNYFVRLIKNFAIKDGNSYPQDRVMRVRQVSGNKVRVFIGKDYYDPDMFDMWNYDINRLPVEIFSEKPQSGDPFIEASNIISIANAGTVSRAFSTSYTLLESGWEVKVARFGTIEYNVWTKGALGLLNQTSTSTASSEDIYYESNSPFNVIGLGYRIGSTYNTNGFSPEQSVDRYNSSIGTGGRFYPALFEDLEKTIPKGIVKYSEKRASNSNINGLRNFLALNEYPLPVERGPIRKLVKAFDTVMLAIHEKESSSMFIGEGFINTGDGQKFLSKTDGVIGDNRELRGDFGTIHPESVCAHNGRVVWFDFNSAEIPRYDLNGITPLAKTYKIRKYLKALCDSLRPYLGQFSVNIGYNRYMDLYLIHFTPFTDGAFEFAGETLVYSNKEGREGFYGFSDLQAEEFVSLNDEMLPFKAGVLAGIDYASNRSKYYGVSYPASVSFVHNDQLSREKIYRSLVEESKSAWAVEISNPEGQETDIETDEFDKIDDLYYADIKRDANTHVDLLGGKPAILFGKEIRSRIVTVKLTESTDNAERNEIESVDVGYIEAPNHFVAAEN